MAEDWNAIAAEVAAAIGSVGFQITLRKATIAALPWDASAITYADTELTCIEDRGRMRDQVGNLVQQSYRTLTVTAGEAVPVKADRVLVRGEWLAINEVRPLAPGGVDLLYELDVQT